MQGNNPFQIGTLYTISYDGKMYDIPEMEYDKVQAAWKLIDGILAKYERVKEEV